jgi:D-3-phosphoglycerate dehydrogenase
MKVLITPRGRMLDLESKLVSRGFEVHPNESGQIIEVSSAFRDISRPEDVTGVVAGLERWSAREFDLFPNLKVISRLGVGLDNVDLEEAKARGIQVFITSDSVVDSVSEHTLALTLTLLRKIHIMDQALKSGIWSSETGRTLSGSRVGLIGLGRIGRSVAAKFSAFGCTVLGYDPYFDFRSPENRPFQFIQMLDLDEVLGTADIVSLHLPLDNQTSGLLGPREFSIMKEESYLVNTSRGEIIQEDALYNAIFEGRLAGAALDVFTKEPYQGPLSDLGNVLLTPHAATNTFQARARMADEALRNLVRGIM